MQLAHPMEKFADMFLDHRFAAADFLLANRERLRRDLLERINIVKKDAVEFIQFRLRVARNGKVDNEERPVRALADDRTELFARQDGMRGAGRADEDIHLGKGIMPVLIMDGHAADFIASAFFREGRRQNAFEAFNLKLGAVVRENDRDSDFTLRKLVGMAKAMGGKAKDRRAR